MVDARGLVARAPLRTVRAAALADVYANPHKEARELVRRGVLHRLAHGFYCEVPAGSDPAIWKPSLEAAGAAVATAAYGDRVPVLMGLSAARLHRALPRAIGQAFVAVPTQRRPIHLADRDATVTFVTRDVGRLDAELTATDLGQALVTTPEQTVLDLARRDPAGTDLDARQAIEALLGTLDDDLLAQLAADQRMGATLRRVKELAG
jgi:hypothetical protein